jgi:ParB family chromosome partitioning protein
MMAERATTLQEVPISEISLSPFNRRDHDEAGLFELAQSIAEHGIIEPVIVRPAADGRYELVAGERRVRAARLAELETVPAIVRHELDDRAAVILQLVENVQRENLNPLLEAEMLDRLVRMCDGSVPEAARSIGRKPAYIEGRLELLTLPGEAQERVRRGELNTTQAQALANLAESPETINRLAAEAVEKRVSGKKLKQATRKPADRPLDIFTMERRLIGISDRLRATASAAFPFERSTFNLTPAADLWVKCRVTGQNDGCSGQVKRVKAFSCVLTAETTVWRVQFVDATALPWEQVERMATDAEIARARKP